MAGWNGLWVGLAMLMIAFGAADCHGSRGMDSLAVAIVKHLEAR